MSTVTDVILTGELGVIDLDAVNGFFAAEDGGYGDARMHKVDKPDGAPGKTVQADVFLGAFNCLDLQGFVGHLRGIGYVRGAIHSVRLFVQEEHYDNGFREKDIWPELGRR